MSTPKLIQLQPMPAAHATYNAAQHSNTMRIIDQNFSVLANNQAAQSSNDYANVNDYLKPGEATFDSAISRALAAKGKAYFPSRNTYGSTYFIVSTILLASGQCLLGDGPFSSIIKCKSSAIPVVTLGSQLSGISIKGLGLTHSVTPTVGGDGIKQPFNWPYASNICTTATASAFSTTLTVGSSSGLSVGMGVFCSGVPQGTLITKINGTSITLSAATTAAIGGTITTTGTGSATTITVASATGIQIQQAVSGTNVANGTYVAGISGTTVILSRSLTGAISGNSISFSNARFSKNIYWINDGIIEDVNCTNNYVGFNLGVAFSCKISRCNSSGNQSSGFLFQSGGHSAGFTISDTSGQIQWILDMCGSGGNGLGGASNGVGDGYAYCANPTANVTGSSGSNTLTIATDVTDTSNGIMSVLSFAGYSVSGTWPNQTASASGSYNPVYVHGTSSSYALTGNSHSTTTIDSITSTAGITAGFFVSGTGVPQGCYVIAVAAHSVTLSSATTSSLTGSTFTFYSLAGGALATSGGVGVQSNGAAAYITAFNQSTGVITLSNNNISAVSGYVYVSGCLDNTSPNGLSVGTLFNSYTYANSHHGFAAYGAASLPINSVRITDGFYGQDAGTCIYLDTYAKDHSISPDAVELAGNWNIYITRNNLNTVVQAKNVFQAAYDGLFSQANNTIINGGNYRNNGAGGVAGSQSGIYIYDGSAVINGVTSRNFGGAIQKFGIAVLPDNVTITGCYLPSGSTTDSTGALINGQVASAAQVGNFTAGIYFLVGTPVNSVVSGCIPSSLNSLGSLGSLTVNGPINATNFISTFSLTTTGNTYTSTLIDGLASTTNVAVGCYVTGSGIPAYTQVTAINSGTSVSVSNATTSTLVGTSILFTGCVQAPQITSTTSLNAQGPVAMNNGLNITSGGINIFAGSSSPTIYTDYIVCRQNAAVGSASVSTSGTGYLQFSYLQTDVDFNGRFVTGIGKLTSNGSYPFTLQGSVGGSNFPGGIGMGTLGNSTTGSSCRAGLTVTGGGMTFSTGVANNGLTVDNANMLYSLGVGNSAGAGYASGVNGQIVVGSAIYQNGVTGGAKANGVNMIGNGAGSTTYYKGGTAVA